MTSWIRSGFRLAGAALLGLAGGLAGCAPGLVTVRFALSLPSHIPLTGIQRIAVLEFSGTSQATAYGPDIADRVAALFRENGYFVISPESSETAIKAMRLVPSRFQDPGVIRAVGKALGADALLFGDLATLRLGRGVETRTERRYAGDREERRVEADAAGNTRLVVMFVPVYEDVEIRTLRRTVEVAMRARLSRTDDGAVVWEDGRSLRQEFKTVLDDGLTQTVPMSDTQLVSQSVQTMLEDLLANILPRKVWRDRVLATAPSGDAYAQALQSGNMAAAEGEWATAVYFWQEAAKLAPDRPEAHANLGVAYEAQDQLVAAEAEYQSAAKTLGSPWTTYLGQVQLILQELRHRP